MEMWTPTDGDISDATFANTLYAVCDRKYDVIAMTRPSGNLAERTDYSPYGVARHRPPADLNGDGKIDGVDQLIFFNAWGAAIGAAAYNPDADINFDGQINGDDFLILNNAFGADPAPPGAVSQHGNTVGYSGYLHDEEIGLSLARFRWYDAETGRWATRDPIGYFDGSNLYNYLFSNPLESADPYGLTGSSCNQIPPAGSRVTGCWQVREYCHNKCNGASLLYNSECHTGCDSDWDRCIRSNVPAYTPLRDDSLEYLKYDSEDDYLGANARCFFKCAGNSGWSQDVRGCLRKLYDLRVDRHIAHKTCYRIGDRNMHPGGRPWLLLAECYRRCSGLRRFIIM